MQDSNDRRPMSSLVLSEIRADARYGTRFGRHSATCVEVLQHFEDVLIAEPDLALERAWALVNGTGDTDRFAAVAATLVEVVQAADAHLGPTADWAHLIQERLSDMAMLALVVHVETEDSPEDFTAHWLGYCRRFLQAPHEMLQGILELAIVTHQLLDMDWRSDVPA